MSDGYDRLWHTERRARGVKLHGARWHRSGDVGHLDTDGNLWIEGRVAHVIHTTHGPVTPVPLEIAAETVPGVTRAAAVGVGPVGVAQVVIVVETETKTGPVAAPAAVRDAVRTAITAATKDHRDGPVPVAAVWNVATLPVDIRHNAKIDRAAVAKQMEQVLSGASTSRFSRLGRSDPRGLDTGR
jgi:acyl-CoA synthetase (AMP-forming)/AMP-acid ligase II